VFSYRKVQTESEVINCGGALDMTGQAKLNKCVLLLELNKCVLLLECALLLESVLSLEGVLTAGGHWICDGAGKVGQGCL
jgi:hypothetical protein